MQACNEFENLLGQTVIKVFLCLTFDENSERFEANNTLLKVLQKWFVFSLVSKA